MTDLWKTVELSVCNLFYNFERRRLYEATLAHRKEGFTEVFGEEDTSDDDDISILCAQPYPNDHEMVLVQYRIAIFEQLVLSLTGMRYTVVNTSYVCNEATGAYPQLRHYQALVGGKENFLQYLKEHAGGVDLDAHLTEPQCQQGNLLRTLLDTKLTTALRVCQFAKARRGWQFWAERVHCGRQIEGTTLLEARTQARQAYGILQAQLDGSSDTTTFLLGTDKPTVIDCLVAEHVLHAIHTSDLVSVLADFLPLVSFCQKLYEKINDNEWNLLENRNNFYFQTTPSLYVMEELAALSMEERVLEASRVQVAPHQPKPFATWHRWRRGDTFRRRVKDTKEPSPQEGMRRQYKRDDEVWMTGIGLASLLVFGVGTLRALSSK